MNGKFHNTSISSRLLLAMGLVGLLFTNAQGRELVTDAQGKEYFTIEDGELARPTGYREWIFIGTPLTPNDMNDGKAAFPEFHNVYIDPASWRHWKATGEFRDGTILVKELVSVGGKAAVSGNGYFQGEYIGLEATIKSSREFPDEPGNWAYFSFSTPDHQSLQGAAKPFPTAACNACHQGGAADDFVFTQYYPVLRNGKATGVEGIGIGGIADALTPTLAK